MTITQVSDVERELRAEIARLTAALAEQPARRDGPEMVDDEGENQAVRMFLALYGGQYGITAEQMRKHLKMAGFDGAWPEWANTHNGHLTKAGAQLWIRHLFALEQPAQPQQEPVAWRELCRRLYVELFHCDWQMTAAWDEEGGPMWQQGATVRDVLADAKAALETSPPAQRKPHDCARSHPHENMDAICELRTEIARLTNENARLKAQPQQEPEIVQRVKRYAGQTLRTARNPNITARECIELANWLAAHGIKGDA